MQKEKEGMKEYSPWFWVEVDGLGLGSAVRSCTGLNLSAWITLLRVGRLQILWDPSFILKPIFNVSEGTTSFHFTYRSNSLCGTSNCRIIAWTLANYNVVIIRIKSSIDYLIFLPPKMKSSKTKTVCIPFHTHKHPKKKILQYASTQYELIVIIHIPTYKHDHYY